MFFSLFVLCSRNQIPIIKVFFSTRANAHIPIEILDLSKETDGIDNIEDPFKWELDVNKIQGI